MAYWLFKSEPEAWSWDDQVKKGAAGEEWTGVRNHTAKQNMKTMKKGELGFFYHSVDEKSVVGIVRVIAEAHPELQGQDGHMVLRRCRGCLADTQACEPCRDQGRASPGGLGAGEVSAAFRAARDRGGMAIDLRNGRHEEGPERTERGRKKVRPASQKTGPG